MIKDIPLRVNAFYSAVVVPGFRIAAVVVNDYALIFIFTQRRVGNGVAQCGRLAAMNIGKDIIILTVNFSQ